MITIEKILAIEDYLKEAFKSHPSRLEHIQRVKKIAISLANIYRADLPSVIVAAYLHDATKLLSDEENIQLADNFYHSSIPPACAHAYAAAKLAVTRFEIKDDDILNAIKYHCSGRKEMSLIEKIIFVSDFIEDGRDFVTPTLRLLAHHDLDRAVLEIMVLKKNYIESINQPLSPLTEEAISQYKKEVEVLND